MNQNQVRLCIVLGLGAWGSFGQVISLEEAYRAALVRSESMAQSEERVTQSGERLAQARGGVFPNLSFHFNHTFQDQADPEFRDFSPQNQTTANFSLSQPLFKGLREFASLSGLRHLRAASESARDGAKSQLYQDVASAYLGVLSSLQDRRNLVEQLALYDRRVGELRLRAKRGESNSSEVVSAESTQASLSAELRLVEGQEQVARQTFGFITGLSGDVQFVDPDLVAREGKPQAVEKYLNHVDSRFDVRAALESLEAARAQVSYAWGEHFPTVDAVGNYYLKRPGFLTGIDWDIGVRVTVPIFEGLATQAKVDEAISKRKEAELEWQRTRRAAELQIRTLHERLTARLEHLVRLRLATELSKKNSGLLERDYRRGLARNIDVQNALAEYRNTQRSFDQSRFTSQLEMIQLLAASAQIPERVARVAPDGETIRAAKSEAGP